VRIAPEILVWFWGTVFLTLAIAKRASLRIDSEVADRRSFWLSPVFSTVSWRKRRPIDRNDVLRLLVGECAWGSLLIFAWKIYRGEILRFHPSTWFLSYCAILPLYFLGQFASGSLQLLYSASGWWIPAHFDLPPLSMSLSEFWGRRWATWVSDGFRQFLSQPTRVPRGVRVALAFAVSGLWHEFLTNAPLFIFFGVNRFGSMLLYFSIQALGLQIDARWLRERPIARWVFLWGVVILPVPLILNEGVLRAVGLFPG
jgi:hypothetical protein